MPADSETIRQLQAAAARAAALVCPACHPGRVVVISTGGERILSVAIPGAGETEPARVGHEPPAITPGWSFTDKLALFDGKIVGVAGSRVKLLGILAGTDEALTAKQLARLAYGEHGDEENARFHVRELRKELQTIFSYEGDPIPNQNGYRLVLR